ncbi:MAG: hypothetical protein ACRD3L_10305 [Terriglobales bacterium]
MKSVFAALLMTAIASIVPQAHAQATVKVMISGASGSWAAVGVGTFKSGSCPTGSLPGCAHYTNSAFNLNDSRPLSKGGATVTDVGTIWIVWDNTTADPSCASGCNVWAYLKVDSIVGMRCYFAQPHCNISVTPFPPPSQSISSAVWGPDSVPPAPVQALFTTGTVVNAGASEIRPEDALFGTCRVNSALGGGNDNLNGLGYGINPSGACPTTKDLAHLQGSNLQSAYPGSTSTAHVLAFNLKGTDPFTGMPIPLPTTVNLGVEPLVLFTARQSALKNVTDATTTQIQTAFSGDQCSGDVFAGGLATPINVYQREPLSGTMNTFEYTGARYPRDSSNNYFLQPSGRSGSQENLIAGANPAGPVPCRAGGGNKYRPIGAGEEVKFVQNSQSLYSVDGIGYTFFSYGNVSSIADSANYAYLSVNGVDPIFQTNSAKYDPAENAAAGTLPGVADLPASCAGGFPCSETVMWKGQLSYPNVRSGAYPMWCIVRLVASGTALANVRALVTSAQASAVNVTPDFIPFARSGTDPGFFLFRSHYTQEGIAPRNYPTELGSDEGGCIMPDSKASPGATKLVQRPNGGCVVGP